MATLEKLEEKLNTLDSILSKKESLLEEKDGAIQYLLEENQRLRALLGSEDVTLQAGHSHRNECSPENRMILQELFGPSQ